LNGHVPISQVERVVLPTITRWHGAAIGLSATRGILRGKTFRTSQFATTQRRPRFSAVYERTEWLGIYPTGVGNGPRQRIIGFARRVHAFNVIETREPAVGGPIDEKPGTNSYRDGGREPGECLVSGACRIAVLDHAPGKLRCPANTASQAL